MDLGGYVLILKETEDNKAKLLGKYVTLIYLLILMLITFQSMNTQNICVRLTVLNETRIKV